MDDVMWPDTEDQKKLLQNIIGAETTSTDNGELYRKAFKKLISGCNEEKFKELIDNCLGVWEEEIQNKIKSVNNGHELLAYSLHYKSPGLGRWFRWPVVPEKGKGKEIFEYDKPLLDVFAEKYLQIPQALNVSLDNEGTKDVFSHEVILEIQEGNNKIKIENGINIILPIDTIIALNDKVLMKNSINTFLDKGSRLIFDKSTKDSQELKEYFEINNNILTVTRLLLSGYVVFRCAEKIKELLNDNNKKLVIIFFPMKGVVSAWEKEGSWFIFLSVDKNITIDINNFSELKNVVLNMWSLIRGHDVNAITHSRSQYRSLDVERLIGELVYINTELVNQENKAKEWIIKSIGDSGKEKESIASLGWPDEVKDKLKHFIGGNKNFIEFLQKLKKTAESGSIKNDNANGLSVSAPVTPIFLYSEPGTGKEALAYLIHLWARCRFINPDKNYYPNKKQLVKKFIDENVKYFKDDRSCLKTFFNAIKYFKDDKNFWDENKLYPAGQDNEIRDKETKDGFFTINCPLLTKDNFSKLVFGTIKEPNGVLKATAYTGTCFFDEFNTLEKRLENNFLRLLAKPYESLVFESKEKDADEKLIKNLNCVYVFASNKTPDELIDEGFNEAVISRISQNYFEVPPLRQRPEDMLLAFINGLTKKKDIGWEKIEPTVLRFLCLLPWKGNFRTLDSFVNDLCNERSRRGINAELVTFQEVVECAVRRKLIGE